MSATPMLAHPSADRFAEWIQLVEDYGGPESTELVGSGFHGNREPRVPVLTTDGYATWLAMLAEEADESVPPHPGGSRARGSGFSTTTARGSGSSPTDAA